MLDIGLWNDLWAHVSSRANMMSQESRYTAPYWEQIERRPADLVKGLPGLDRDIYLMHLSQHINKVMTLF